MNSSAMNSLIQAVTLIAIIAGVLLVVFELRQSREIARAQLYSDGLTLAVQNDNAIIGENPGLVLAKACFDPEALTPEEKFILQNIYVRQLNTIGRIMRIEDVSDVYEKGTWKSSIALFPILSTAYGRAWWMTIEPLKLPEMSELRNFGIQQMQLFESGGCIKTIEAVDRKYVEMFESGSANAHQD